MQTQTDINTPSGQPFSMSEKARKLADECATRKGLLIALSDNQCFSDAIMLLSYAMPHQKGLHWALKCVRNNSQSNNQSLDAAEKWLNEPSEENRANILPTGIVEKPTTATWVAMENYRSGSCID